VARHFLSEGYWAAVLKAGLCKFLILKALGEGPVHGYQLIRRVGVMTGGFCEPTEGTIYPVLREFERAGCVRRQVGTVFGRPRKVYALTAKGRQALRAGVQAWKQGLACVRRAVEHNR
jgi:DNA-binding PadR family transcriptional regulator